MTGCMSSPPLIGSLRIIESAYAPLPRQLLFPKKGPYYQRRLKRSRLDRRNYSGIEFIVIGNDIICHPSLIPLLSQTFGKVSA